MKAEKLLKAALVLLVMGLCVTLISWIGSEFTQARAQGGGGGEAGEWIMVASTLREGEGLIYVINTRREVLLVYAYHRGRRARDDRRFTGHLEILAGRHMRWDVMYVQQSPFPRDRDLYREIPTPAEMQRAFEELTRD